MTGFKSMSSALPYSECIDLVVLCVCVCHLFSLCVYRFGTVYVLPTTVAQCLAALRCVCIVVLGRRVFVSLLQPLCWYKSMSVGPYWRRALELLCAWCLRVRRCSIMFCPAIWIAARVSSEWGHYRAKLKGACLLLLLRLCVSCQ